jgi:predicted nucleic acid-binding protein
MPVVDASVCVALFKADELDHAACRSWLVETLRREETIVSPVVLLPEVASGMARGLGDTAAVQEAIGILRGRRFIELSPVTESVAAFAAEIAAKHGIRGSDALYVALASRLDMELVTLDRQQRERGAFVVKTRRP